MNEARRGANEGKGGKAGVYEGVYHWGRRKGKGKKKKVNVGKVCISVM